MSYWSKLSMKDRADVMKLFLDKGISDLDTMRREYNIFAGGGNTNDADLVDWIIREEGFNTKPEDIGDGKITLGSGLTDPKWHALYKKRGNKWSEADNRMAVAEEVANRRKWAEKTIPNWEALPDSSQKALLSYKYNYDFTPSNSPKLFKALSDSNFREAARQMDATSKDPKFKEGLMERRLREQEWFLSDLANQSIHRPNQTLTPINTSLQQITAPAVSTAVTNKYVPSTIHPYTRLENARRAIESTVAFNRMIDNTSIQNNLSEYQFPIGNGYANGGKIHIKPENRGKFTALKKRTGHSATWFKEHGTPAQKKMATFALNARKWKHGLGGNLFDGITESSQQMAKPNIFQRPDGSYFYSSDGTEIDVTPMNTLGDDPAQWTYVDSSNRVYKPNQALQNNYTLTEAEDVNPLERAANNYFRELDWRVKNDPSSIALQGKYTMPLILSPVLSKGAAVALTNPYVDAALTSGFGAHGLQSLANGEADWSTALEIAPLGRVVKPIYEGVVQPGMRLFNSPLTGNWTRIGNKEYRLSPSSLGANGSPIESRGIVPQITAENAAHMTPEQWTAAQDAAIARGDMVEAQRLRDLHFNTKSSGSDVSKILYNHSTDSEPFYSFDLDRSANYAGSTRNGRGVYTEPLINLSEEPNMAVWGRNYQGDWGENNFKLRINFENPETPIADNPISTHPEGYVGRIEAFVRDPRKIKLDDAVTYDDNSVRIPLGERDNFKLNDIRYGLLPFGIGLTGYGLWRGNK